MELIVQDRVHVYVIVVPHYLDPHAKARLHNSTE